MHTHPTLPPPPTVLRGSGLIAQDPNGILLIIIRVLFFLMLILGPSTYM